jgi:lipoate-protein ligase A
VTCDVFPLLTTDGPTQMAADEALLEHVLGTDRPALRFYIWDPPTLSLGYFQPFAECLPGLPVVRRMTGGGAIVHDRELTYALGLPPTEKPRDWPCRMHDIVHKALDSCGVTTASSRCGTESGRGRFLCFEHHTPGDLLLGGHKIGGSAQRRRNGAVVQHGSILLGASPYAPQLRGIKELIGVEVTPRRLADEIVTALTDATGWTMAPIDWSTQLDLRREQLLAERYGDPNWTQRR